jgi:hypothetical protein
MGETTSWSSFQKPVFSTLNDVGSTRSGRFDADFPTLVGNLTRIEHDFHNFNVPRSVVSFAMRQAFVLQLGTETDTARGHFAGVIEEVDTGRELRFRSTEELLKFLARCFEDASRGDSTSEEPLLE